VAFGDIAAAGIYAIVDVGTTRDPLGLLDAILRGGVRVVQYRAKTGVDTSLLQAMLQRTRASGARLIVNDDLLAARAADGWHGGQEDLEEHDRSQLRAELGPGILGISCGTPTEARDAEEAGADYVGVGPFAATNSKSDAGPAIGTAGIAAVVRSTRLPVVAIGGIHAGNLAEVFASGASMAAVISAIAAAPDPEAATRDLVDRWRALAQGT
jgi:thiamine-phosphate pyrophosphorylase